jgi:hypothetical protein
MCVEQRPLLRFRDSAEVSELQLCTEAVWLSRILVQQLRRAASIAKVSTRLPQITSGPETGRYVADILYRIRCKSILLFPKQSYWCVLQGGQLITSKK